MFAINYKRRTTVMLLSFLMLLLLSSCPGGRKIKTQDDADLVARSLWKQIRMTVHYGTEATYNNQQIAGTVSGNMVVNGDIVHSSHYDGMFDWQVFNYDLTIDCDNFCTTNEFTNVHFTGDITLDGSIDCRWSDYWYEYLYMGLWNFVGSGKLSGEFSGDVSFALRVLDCGNYFGGTLTADGKQWNVSFDERE